ncbi:MAG: hypothetical protein KDB53_03200, partial [Planctomycetes bacterium]|nr:hypothetical protein [Planctomycetota bacterium]
MKIRTCLALSLALLMAAAVHADTIVLRGKAPISGVKIKSETFEKVVYNQGRGSQEVPSSEVLAVIYDGPPRDFRLGLERLNLGDFVNAIERLKSVASSGADAERPW